MLARMTHGPGLRVAPIIKHRQEWGLGFAVATPDPPPPLRITAAVPCSLRSPSIPCAHVHARTPVYSKCSAKFMGSSSHCVL